MAKKTTSLGVTNDLNDIDVKDLLNNETAINMLLHENQKLENENMMLKQDLNRQSTIERTLLIRKTYTKVAAVISVFSTLLISFGINFITSDKKDIKGYIILILGIISEIISLYFSFKGDEE